jgi:SAM-dependent methyltransferase
MGQTEDLPRSVAEGASIDLGNGHDRQAESILDWPDGFVSTLKGRLMAIRAGAELSPDDLAELAAHGLVDASSGHPTDLGQQLIELVVRETWQEGAEHRTFGEMGVAEPVGSALEIGCSTGWALRSLRPSPGGQRMGVDIDAKALAIGYRFSKLENGDCRFSRCSVLSLPLEDESVDFIICRNTLTYVNQRAALSEMSRVLKPDGRIFLRFENIWYDLWQVAHSRTLRSLALRVRDLGLGLIHAAAGWQPREGSRFRVGRAFVAVPRLRRALRICGCEIARIDESLRCPRFWGFATQTSVLARKVGDSCHREPTHRARRGEARRRDGSGPPPFEVRYEELT